MVAMVVYKLKKLVISAPMWENVQILSKPDKVLEYEEAPVA